MSPLTLLLSPNDPVIARDGRPFGAGAGDRMHTLPWPLPSVVAGALRTALVKAAPNLDFSGDMPGRLLDIEVAGVFPVAGGEIYLPAPMDALAEPERDGGGIRTVHRLVPQDNPGGCDFPDDLRLRPVMLSAEQSEKDFKPAESPAWWPIRAVERWLLGKGVRFDESFLCSPQRETRYHVSIDPRLGVAAQGRIFATSALNVSYMPRFHPCDESSHKRKFFERFAQISLTCRVTVDENLLGHLRRLNGWYPLGGERRLVHWRVGDEGESRLWDYPAELRSALGNAEKIRMVLVTPAIFERGWLPGWLDDRTLEGTPPFGNAPAMRLLGVVSGRWEAVSGWSLARPVGPKPVRRAVPAGSVYFFERLDGEEGFPFETAWLRPVSDGRQERNDGFGLAVWGTW